MSLRFAGTSGYARINSAATLGNTVNGSILTWYRKEDSTADREIISLTRPGGGATIHAYSATQIRGGYTSNLAGMSFYNVSNGTYIGLALTYADGTISFYAYDGSDAVLVGTDNSSGSGANLNIMTFGNTGAWGAAAVGCHRYGRYWSRVLSLSELTAEFEMTPSVGTPAASTTSLRGSWLFPDSTTNTDLSGLGNTITIANGSTSSDEPPIGGGGSPVNHNGVLLLGVG